MLLVNVECVVHLSLSCRTHSAESDALSKDKATKTLPKALPQAAVDALIEAVERDRESRRRTDWFERDLALILSSLLAGLRADELRRADVGDIRTAATGGAIIHVRGNGSKTAPSRLRRTCYRSLKPTWRAGPTAFQKEAKSPAGTGLSFWPANIPLFVDRDGDRITRGTLRSRVGRAFRQAGRDAQPV